MVQEIAIRTMSTEVLQWIRDAILRGQLTADARIDQRAISQRLGVSLVPVREALRKLEAEGLVQIIPHRGAYVPRISRDEMEDIYTVRMAIEPMTIKHAVRRITADDLDRTKDMIVQMD